MTAPTSSTVRRVALDAAWQAVTLAALAASPAVLAADLLRGRGARPMRQRWGRAPHDAGAPAWIAAASAGEVAVAAPLLRRLHALDLAPLVLSVGTRHGLGAAARHEAFLAAPAFHPPLDALPCVGRALGRLRPRVLVTIETELWPNLFRGAARRGVAVAIVNARLSARAFPRSLRARPLLQHALRDVRLVAARTPEDAERWLALGAPKAAVVVSGNLKFDAAAATAQDPELPWAAAAGLHEGPWVAFGSTAEGEEDAVLEAFRSARASIPGLRGLLAPKRPERWDVIAARVRELGLPLVRRSSWEGAGATPVPAGGVLLLDSTGELARGYRHARCAFVGGSLVAHGGQNLLEPAAAGVPVLFGPHVANFRDAEEALLATGGGRRIEAGSLAEEIMRIVMDEAWRRRLSQGATAAVAAHAGATERTVELLRPLLEGGAR